MWVQTKIEPAFVLFFDCPEEEMERRILNRNQVRLSNYFEDFICLFYLDFHYIFAYIYILFLSWPFWLEMKGREDDNIDTIRKRFKVFLESSLPVVEHYNSKGKVRKVILQYFIYVSFLTLFLHVYCNQLKLFLCPQIDATKPVEEVFEAVKSVFTPTNEQVKHHRNGWWNFIIYRLCNERKMKSQKGVHHRCWTKWASSWCCNA